MTSKAQSGRNQCGNHVKARFLAVSLQCLPVVSERTQLLKPTEEIKQIVPKTLKNKNLIVNEDKTEEYSISRTSDSE